MKSNYIFQLQIVMGGEALRFIIKNGEGKEREGGEEGGGRQKETRQKEEERKKGRLNGTEL